MRDQLVDDQMPVMSAKPLYIIGGYTQVVTYFNHLTAKFYCQNLIMQVLLNMEERSRLENLQNLLSCRRYSTGDCTNVWDGSTWSEVNALPKMQIEIQELEL